MAQQSNPQTARRSLGAAIAVGALGAAAWLSPLTACETQQAYAACALDPEVTDKGVCDGKGSSTSGKTSCRVIKHPHCAEGVCLSYFGTESVCTENCVSDGDCAGGGFCWQYAEGEKYCVPSDRKL